LNLPIWKMRRPETGGAYANERNFDPVATTLG